MGKKKGKSVRKPNSRSVQQDIDDSSISSASGAKKKKTKSKNRERNQNHKTSQDSTIYDDDGFRKTLQGKKK